MDHKQQEPRQRDTEIAAYVCGDMEANEAAQFERRMDSDERLRREVEEWRKAFAAAEEWAGSEPPGIERAEQIKVPALPIRRTEQLRHVLASLRTGRRPRLATAVVFVAGFVLGALMFRQPAPLPSQREGTPVEPPVTVTAEQEETGVPLEDEKAVESKPPEPTEPRQETTETRVAAVSQPRYVTQEDGRVIVETTLQRSGARVVMVVDGGFQINQGVIESGGR
jgi:anti-sigma factor RsiW